MWVFNTRHDFGVETDPTQGEFFVKTSSTAEQCPTAIDLREGGIQKTIFRTLRWYW